MVVPPLSLRDKPYQSLKDQLIAAGGYQACGRAIELVDEFMYLGVCIWYHWDWTRAWNSARQRARRMLYSLRQAGMQNRGTPLVYQLRFAASQVLSHLDYIAAIAGVEGSGDGEILKNDMLVDHLLRFVTGCPPSTCGDALKAEAGVWHTETRVRMLQLRLFVKLALMDKTSTHFRAMCLSRQHSDPMRCSGATKYFTWFDGVLSSASYFDIPASEPDGYADNLHLRFTAEALRPVLTLVRVDRKTLLSDVWEAIDCDTPDVPGQLLRVRAAHDGVTRFDYSTGKSVSEWFFPPETSIQSAWFDWSNNLREASFAELRFRGNSLRQLFFQDTLLEWCVPDSGQRDLAPMKDASYLEPYWFADDPHAARCILRARIGCSKLEFDYRRAPHHYPRAPTSSKRTDDGPSTEAIHAIAVSTCSLQRSSRQTRMARLDTPHATCVLMTRGCLKRLSMLCCPVLALQLWMSEIVCELTWTGWFALSKVSLMRSALIDPDRPTWTTPARSTSF